MSTEAVTIPVGGMTCAACQSRVQRTLQRSAGVEDAAVNLILGTAAIRYDTERTSPAALVEVIRGTGYEASLPVAAGNATAAADASDRAQQDDYRALRTRAMLALVAGAIAMAVSMPLMAGAGSGTSVDPLMHVVMTHVAPALQRLLPWLFLIPRPVVAWGLMALTVAVMVGAGRQFYVSAWAALRHGAADMNTLVAVGTGAAFFYSAIATVAPQTFTAHGVAADLYYEAVVLIIAFVLTGRMLEARATRRTAAALRSLGELQPATARIERGGALVEVPIATVIRGDVVLVRPGERVPVDGDVVEGESAINESLLTGEAALVPKAPGDAVIGGSINDSGALRVRATSVGDASTLAGILRLLRDAQNSRAPIQQLADRISAIFVPAIIVLSIVTFGAWALLAHDAPLLRGFSAAVAVLIVACPCAMGLAVPTAVMVATGRGAQLGVLIRGGDALQRAGEVDTIVFDKTGTLTTGLPSVVAVVPTSAIDEAGLLALAAAVEIRSEHPLGAAIVTAARARGIVIPDVAQFQSEGGMGASASVADHPVLVGSQRFLSARGIAVDQLDALVPLAATRSTLVYVARDGTAVGVIALADSIRPDAHATVARLRALGLHVALVSGDRDLVAAAIAAEAGIDDVVGGVLPAGKVAEIQRRQQGGRVVAMVGDGVNDAPALAQADVGVAMSGGAGIAVEAADIALLGGRLAAIPDAVILSRATLRIIRQNLFWAFGYNVVAVPIAAGVLYPVAGILLSPVIASAAMALSSVSVVMNSLRLRR